MPNSRVLLGNKTPASELEPKVKKSRLAEVIAAIEDADPRFENMTPQEIRDDIAKAGAPVRAIQVKRGNPFGPADRRDSTPAV